MCLESSYAEQQGQQPMLRKISDQHTVEVGIQALDDLLQKAGGQLSHVGHWSADLLPHCLWKLWSVRWNCCRTRWRRQSSIRWRCCRIRCLVRWCACSDSLSYSGSMRHASMWFFGAPKVHTHLQAPGICLKDIPETWNLLGFSSSSPIIFRECFPLPQMFGCMAYFYLPWTPKTNQFCR